MDSEPQVTGGDFVQGDQYVLSGDFRHATITIYERGVAVARIPFQRPPVASHFTGRGPELERLLTELRPGHIVTLNGPGGIGKTALAAEALAALFDPLAPRERVRERGLSPDEDAPLTPPEGREIEFPAANWHNYATKGSNPS